MAGINPMSKKGKGRRKIETKEVENEASRQVMFSKRGSAVFDNAGDLSLQTGAEVATIVSSQKGNVFTFGHPSANSVIDLAGDSPPAPEQTSTENQIMQEDKEGYVQMMEELEGEKKQTSENPLGLEEDLHWWDKDIDGMGLEELEDFIKSMEELRNNMRRKAEEKAKERETSTNFGAA